MISSFKNEELVKVQGKTYPVVGGRLRLAHDENKLLSIETNILFYNEDAVVIQAHVKTEKGAFSGIGNSSAKRDRILANAIIELAETRAIARALRFAGYGVEYTGYEEMGEIKNTAEINSGLNEITIEENTDTENATKTQLSAIFSMAHTINMSNDELRKLIQEMTGKSYSKELSKKDASAVINFLKQKEALTDTDSH